mmetsp:Transcript_46457/g.92236  ORF Transcript_46457/g.92236 Transcript_46457/m.92236 type:complete len:180 (+) Transcript_46457:2024-2563(+)
MLCIRTTVTPRPSKMLPKSPPVDIDIVALGAVGVGSTKEDIGSASGVFESDATLVSGCAFSASGFEADATFVSGCASSTSGFEADATFVSGCAFSTAGVAVMEGARAIVNSTFACNRFTPEVGTSTLEFNAETSSLSNWNANAHAKEKTTFQSKLVIRDEAGRRFVDRCTIELDFNIAA